jgi:hypothetical protein
LVGGLGLGVGEIWCEWGDFGWLVGCGMRSVSLVLMVLIRHSLVSILPHLSHTPTMQLPPHPRTHTRTHTHTRTRTQGDSVVTPEIACDLMMECKRIGEGRLQCPDVLGAFCCGGFWRVCVCGGGGSGGVCCWMDGWMAYRLCVRVSFHTVIPPHPHPSSPIHPPIHHPIPPTRPNHPHAPHTGNVAIDPIFPGEAYDVYLSGDKMQRSERAELIRAYRKRVPFQTSREKEEDGAAVAGLVAGQPRRRKRGEEEETDDFFHYN